VTKAKVKVIVKDVEGMHNGNPWRLRGVSQRINELHLRDKNSQVDKLTQREGRNPMSKPRIRGFGGHEY
jgi:hypothetical protein